ncbi:MAG: hypothetical protein M3Q85_06180 [Acidobacteriota bacterium]|jgi:hypothetical protein|nr:hypothetical protein [Acidobacteriota bacterium]
MMTRQSGRTQLSAIVALFLVTAACGGSREAGAPATTAVRVTDVGLGRSVGGDKAITDRTDTFRPNDTIYASVATEGSASSATLRARWTFEDGQVVDESTRTIVPNNRERTEFHISKPNAWPSGKYKLEVFLDNQSVETKDFEVRGS